jgi:integrase/recombinase XerC
MFNSEEDFSFESFEDEHEWVVVRAKQKDSTWSIPADFPLLVDRASRRICEPVLLFVHQTYVDECAKKAVLNTCLAYTRDGKDWMNHLEEFGLSWQDAQLEDLIAYVRIMNTTYAPSTGKLYATKTINRRSMFVLLFYFWASKYFKSPQGEGEYLLQIDRSLRRTQKRIKKVKLPPREEEDIAVKVLSKAQAASLMQKLGPTPSTWVAQCSAKMRSDSSCRIKLSSRNRLSSETALKTGLRVSGTCSLRTSHFARFKAMELAARKYYVIKVLEKGKLRNVKFSGELIAEILIYIDYERDYIVRSCGKPCGDALFLNPFSSGKHVGKGVTSRTLERAINSACFSCGLTETEVQKHFVFADDGSIVEVESNVAVASFVFHQLRHTFAVWLYCSLQKAGEDQPWLIVQARLGHSSDKVTRDIYLAAIGEFEAEVSDAYMEMFYVGK